MNKIDEQLTNLQVKNVEDAKGEIKELKEGKKGWFDGNKDSPDWFGTPANPLKAAQIKKLYNQRMEQKAIADQGQKMLRSGAAIWDGAIKVVMGQKQQQGAAPAQGSGQGMPPAATPAHGPTPAPEGVPQPPGGFPAPGQAVKISSPDQLDDLPPGTHVILPNGREAWTK